MIQGIFVRFLVIGEKIYDLLDAFKSNWAIEILCLKNDYHM
ncbi:Phage protein [Listeria monocytogenes]|nr:hypothetical protein [Listeria monocytogenes]ADB67467.1 hypothetical protein LM5578_0712 [Listeria monocytogenes 08-5578]ADB70512.1 hypothetical protein LM5923_0667 [Listeria monocytogenes 08-5923]EAL06284.1 conserved hypothetical protein [Listeria monocytogenes str. 1/2a F6854] [Listeria monocytogenes serotype 1/2a str. F6854]EEW14011.1 phage protein [Listeria monocytogenes FSL N3-165]EFF97585.1 phage protein [Listeria monocytogenes J2818]EXL14234.1 hypothetical protein X843_1529 [Listeri